MYGARCSRASRSSNQSVFIVTGSSHWSSAHDGVERLVHARALGDRLDAQHVGVGHQRARAAAEHGAAARHVVELDEAVRHQQRVVVGQAGHAGAEHDVRVRSAAAAMKISGEAISSQPAEWCSPIHASS